MLNGWLYYATLGTIGALISVLVGVLSRFGAYYLMGLVPLFPSFALLAHILAATSGGTHGMRTAATFGLYSLVPYAGYLVAILLCSRTQSALVSIALAIAVWAILAISLVLAWRQQLLPGSG